MDVAVKAVPVMAGSASEKLRPAQGGGGCSSDGPLSLPDAQALQRVDGRRGVAVVGAAARTRPRKFESGIVAVPERVTIVMRLLSEAAEAGEVCPTNEAIRAAIGAASDASGVDAMALLESMNLIDIERTRNSRVVTIVKTGKSTKRPRRMVSMAARESAADVRAANRRKRIALFCDALSAGTPDAPVTIKEAGRVAGVSEPTAHSFLAEVRRDLGWQAQ